MACDHRGDDERVQFTETQVRRTVLGYLGKPMIRADCALSKVLIAAMLWCVGTSALSPVNQGSTKRILGCLAAVDGFIRGDTGCEAIRVLAGCS